MAIEVNRRYLRAICSWNSFGSRLSRRYPSRLCLLCRSCHSLHS